MTPRTERKTIGFGERPRHIWSYDTQPEMRKSHEAPYGVCGRSAHTGGLYLPTYLECVKMVTNAGHTFESHFLLKNLCGPCERVINSKA